MQHTNSGEYKGVSSHGYFILPSGLCENAAYNWLIFRMRRCHVRLRDGRKGSFLTSHGAGTWTNCPVELYKVCTARSLECRRAVAMQSPRLILVALAVACSLTIISAATLATPPIDGPLYEKFTSSEQAGVGLRFIRNSGVCETTPGVNQLSGYIDFGTNMSMVSLLGCARLRG